MTEKIKLDVAQYSDAELLNMRNPAKWELKEFAKLADMVDFLKTEYRPFTAIAREAVRLGIIKQEETSRLYSCFSICTGRIGAFYGQFYPSDQTPTGRNRWEWKLKEEVTKESFLKEITEYIRRNFKTP